jgi:hypothetical protein
LKVMNISSPLVKGTSCKRPLTAGRKTPLLFPLYAKARGGQERS